MQLFQRRHQGGFTLVEAMISVVIVFIVGLGLIVSVSLSRQRAEFDKQRIAAISHARTFMEEARRVPNPAVVPEEDVVLDNFNTPDDVLDDLNASVSRKLYAVETDGSRGEELSAAPANGDRYEVEVSVTWNRTGRLSGHTMTETLRTYGGPDL